jgi:hypothetical protein
VANVAGDLQDTPFEKRISILHCGDTMGMATTNLQEENLHI